jgi:hypothetical protein
MARVIAAIVAGIEASEKPTKPKSVASEAPVTEASATETAAVKAAGHENRRHAPRHFQLRSTSKGNHNNGYRL